MIGGLEYDATIKGLEFQQRGRWLQIEYKGNTQVRPFEHQGTRPALSSSWDLSFSRRGGKQLFRRAPDCISH